VPGRGDDYELDKDPLAYMTTDYPSPYLAESEINMQRRFLWRGLHRNRGWKRTTAIALTIMSVGLVVFAVVATVVGVLRAVF
jgi:predicted anti-sigma-YlaC factor YlaD